MRTTKTLVGAGIGALFGTLWATVGLGWASLVVVLSLLGAAIGQLIDNPGRAIELLERLQER